MSRKLFLLIAIASVVVAIVVGGLWLGGREIALTNQHVGHADAGRAEVSKSDEKESTEAQREVLDDPELQAELRQKLDQNAIVDFTGLLLDQYEQPVSGAAIEFEVTAYSEAALLNLMVQGWGASSVDKNTGTIETDLYGRFRIQGYVARSMRIRLPNNDKYVPAVGEQKLVFTHEELTNNGSDGLKTFYVVDQSIGTTGVTTSPNFAFQLGLDEPEVKELSVRRVFGIESAKNEKILVTLKTLASRENPEKGASWQVSISGDGIAFALKETVEFVARAPANGYQEELLLGEMQEANDWRGYSEGTYFFRVGDNVFGLFDLRVGVSSTGRGYVGFSNIRFNESGRNLVGRSRN